MAGVIAYKLFRPAESKTISASTTSANAAWTAGVGDKVTELRVYNAATAVAFIRWGTGAQTAVNTDMAIAPGATEVFYKGYSNNVAVILASGTGSVYVSAGEGA